MKATIAILLVIAFSSCKKETIQPLNNSNTGNTPANSYTGNIKQAQSALLPSAANNLPKSHTPLYEELPDKISGVYYGNVYGHCDGDICGDMANYGEGIATVTKISKDVISVTTASSGDKVLVYQGITADKNFYWFKSNQPNYALAYFKIDSNNISFQSDDGYCAHAFYGVK